MKRAAVLFALVFACLCLFAPVAHGAASGHHRGHKYHHPQQASINFRGRIVGKIIDYEKAAAIQPDFDRVDRVVMKSVLYRHNGPHMTLVLDAYIENFQSFTTPTLIDLIHPKHYVSYQMGGFFTGKAIVTDASGTVLFDGLMLMEAFNYGPNHKANSKVEVNHMIIRDSGEGAANGGVLNLDSMLLLHRSGVITGTVWGHSHMSAAATAALSQPGNGSGGLSLQEILKQFRVDVPLQKGLGVNCNLRKLYCAKHGIVSSTTTSTKPPSPFNWRMWLGVTFIALAGILLIVFFWQEVSRKRTPALLTGTSEESGKASGSSDSAGSRDSKKANAQALDPSNDEESHPAE